ncbi:MAG: response regulator transcription factor [Rhodospirillaceae bacterium]|nr:response regulator transcription factor [Rhodospirillaceae bacterium]
MNQHIVVVEDDPFAREVIGSFLTAQGYRVSAVPDGPAMFDALGREPAQLILMDLRLPGEDGLSLTRRVRDRFDVGIIILTARDEIDTRVRGLDNGADDYVTKPFDERELLARIKSVLRRLPNEGAATKAAPGAARPWHDFHGFRLNETSGELFRGDGQRIELTGNEARLLAYLVRHSGQAVPRETLMTEVLQRPWSPSDRSIDVLITRVRGKIEPDNKSPTIIKTVRGIGYVLTPETIHEVSPPN